MSTLAKGLGLVLFLLAAGPAASSGQTLHESPAATAQLAGIQLPMAVDTFDVVRIRAHATAGLGIIASYATPLQGSSDFTLFVFSNGDDVEDHFESAIQEISSQIESGGGPQTSLTVDEQGPIQIEAGRTYAGYRAMGTMERNGDQRRTWLYVFEKNGQLVKFRASTPEADVERITPHLDAFVEGTLDGLEVQEAPIHPEGLLWEQPHGPMRLAGLHLPLVADGFAATDIERSPRSADSFRVTYRSRSEADPVVTVIVEPPREDDLAPLFARAYEPVRSGAEQQGWEFDEDPFLICTWRVPGDETVEGISGGVTAETPNGPRHVQVIAAEVDPWHLTFTLVRPAPDNANHGFEPILAEILARVASDGTAARVEDQPRTEEAPAGFMDGAQNPSR